MANSIRSSVQAAINAGSVPKLQQLVETHGAAAVRLDEDPDNRTAQHDAVGRGQIEVVEYLLSPLVGADPGAAWGNHFAPLHAAAMFGHAAICTMLLEAGADVNVQTDPQGYAPLHSAAFAGHVEAVRVLLAHGADRSLVNYRGERPSETAKRQGQIQAQKLLETSLA